MLQGAGEQHRVLRHEADRVPQRGEAHVARVHAVDEHAAGARLQHPQEHEQEAGLSAARGARDAHLRLRLEHHVDALQHVAGNVRVAGLEVLDDHPGAVGQPTALHLEHQERAAAAAELADHEVDVPHGLVHADDLVPSLRLLQLAARGAQLLQRAGRRQAEAAARHLQERLAVAKDLCGRALAHALELPELGPLDAHHEAVVLGVALQLPRLLLRDVHVLVDARQGDEL
mmetsp:Transcript_15800/g.49750  ORF Transcript_15800/g.49750 Transcript_15800/m.49750 type:complete len:230 (+) Transcript_15800:479-1168(+)